MLRRNRWWAIAIGAVMVVAAGCGTDGNSQRGVTNLTWDSAQIKFDYHADRSCNIKFHYVYLDSQGSVLDEADDQDVKAVTTGEDYHVTIKPATFLDSVPDGTKRIDITPNCQ